MDAPRPPRDLRLIGVLAGFTLLTLAACGGDDGSAPSATRTATPTATPRPTPGTPVVTAHWLAGPIALDTFESGLEGRDFLNGVYLQDAAGRFCSHSEDLAIRVDVDGTLERTLTIGVGRRTGWRVPIVTIPPAPSGTYDLVVECGVGLPPAFRIDQAVRYSPGYVATPTPTRPGALAAVPTRPPTR